MKWIARKSGKKYGYVNRRVDGKVRSLYIGSGPVAMLMARLQALVRAEQVADEVGWQKSQQKLAAADTAVAALFNKIQALQ